ncbi:MAG: hypothetical protein KAS12_04800 [Candidatus Aenigmarchaeota archaeon]|nr:hypothetical protein [Candidatus Aenigmarchaeota archaeon]
MKSTIHIDYSSNVKLRRVSGLRYDAVLEIGDGCELYLSQKHLKSMHLELSLLLEKK